jgi:hypothetical protein
MGTTIFLGCGPSISTKRSGSKLVVSGRSGLVEEKPSGPKAKPPFSGFCVKAKIASVVKVNSNNIKACYERGLTKDSTLAGRVMTVWRIGLQGQVLRVTTETEDLDSEDVLECMCREVLTWRFPKPDGGLCQIKYPFVFSSGP